MVETLTKSAKSQDAERAQKRGKRVQPVHDQLKQAAEPEDSQGKQALVEIPVTEQASLAKDPQVFGAQRAEAMLNLQQTYGNRYVQRVAELGEKAATGDSVTGAMVSRVQSSQGHGYPLPEPLYQRAERALGMDLGDVRVHADEESDRMVTQAGALAFTVGQEIFVPRAAFPPRQSEEWQILAHELVHTVQQRVGIGSEPEREAEQAGQKILQGKSIHLSPARSSVVTLQRAVAPGSGTVRIQRPSFTSYNIKGSTLADVQSQLRQLRGDEDWGRCYYDFRYNNIYRNGVATRVNIVLRLRILLPRWTGSGWRNASRAAKAEWQRMLGCLRTHENGHAKIARRWAYILQRRLLNQTEENVPGTYEAVKVDHKAADDKYCLVTTKHGKTQGVYLNTTIP
jgi:predicted secreted Zn-dependent protease